MMRMAPSSNLAGSEAKVTSPGKVRVPDAIPINVRATFPIPTNVMSQVILECHEPGHLGGQGRQAVRKFRDAVCGCFNRRADALHGLMRGIVQVMNSCQ